MIIVLNKSNKKNVIGDESFMKEPLPIVFINAILAFFGSSGEPPNSRRGSLI